MNHLVAKTKGSNSGYYKLISDVEIFTIPDDLDNRVTYEAAYKLEDDEWFAIDDFSTKDFCIEFLTRRFISADYNQIATVNYSKIEYLCSYQTGAYCFQKLSDSQIIRKKYLSLSNTPVFIEDEPIVVINNIPDAIYKKNEDVLYFKKLTTISSIFRGIDSLYKEATQVETESFLQNDFIQLENEFDANKVKTANRKRIAMAMDTVNTFSDTDRQSIFGYIKDYCEDLQYDEESSHFNITSEIDLKKLLFGIEQRYYTTLLGGEKRLANSILVL
ncbi:hypothetical protein EHS13_23100 [Paenibacillus psychroresistens]|uniref:ATP F0F1 synthase synthase n=1 Tax=Paenibacillus psychroresistens TaxID=1778678 RepID=A0A6B8RNG5_9BACL|nr:hypothetical protein [Paenibacillus psychroresistens]QGQ97569.1 hypothetical protein EHS13_23100 [Paenibacillus psychroresistens]